MRTTTTYMASMLACIIAALAWIVPVPPALPTSVTVYPDRIVVEETGQVIKMTNGRSALAEALEQIPTGGAILAKGAHPGITLGSGSTSGKFSVYRSSPLDATVMGDGSFTIPSIAVSGGIRVDYFELNDFIMKGRNVLRPFVVDMGTNQGTIVLRNGRWEANGQTQFDVRGHGTATWKIVKNNFLEPGQEHPFYLDNVQGAEIYDNKIGPWGRTGGQLVARTYPSGNLPPKGDIYIAGNEITGTGSAGGAGITIAGHINGEVHIGKTKGGKVNGNTIRSNEKTGGMVAYLDEKQYLLKNPTAPPGQRVIIGPGYVLEGKWAVESLHVYDPDIELPYCDRYMMSFGAVKELHIHASRSDSTYIRGPKWALEVAHDGNPCGSVDFYGPTPPSTWDWDTGQPEFVLNKVPFDPDLLWTDTR